MRAENNYNIGTSKTTEHNMRFATSKGQNLKGKVKKSNSGGIIQNCEKN